MTLTELEKRIDAIRKEAPDWEAVHGVEDVLLWDFVSFIGEVMGGNDVGDLACALLDWRKESEGQPRWAA